MMLPDFARAVNGPLADKYSCFLAGPLVAGQRQALIERLRILLEGGVPGYAVLVLLPDRSTSRRFRQQVDLLDLGPYGAVDLQTYYGLASRLIRLFWPLVAGGAGFAAPERPPVFLNYETAQYLMGQLVEPVLAQGYFEGFSMRPQRILSQLLDDLNKSAVSGFGLAEVAPRLSQAWAGEESRLRFYGQVQTCIELYRGHCLQHGLLDASLVFEVFNRHLVAKDEFWRYFTERYRHLLVDSVEELVPVAQDLVSRLLPLCDSALLGGDERAGFRIFLGVDAPGAGELQQQCQEAIVADPAACADPHLMAFAYRIGEKLGQGAGEDVQGAPRQAVVNLIQTRYRAQMIESVARQITQLVDRGVAPGEIAVVAPHADGVLRFLLAETFRAADIPFAVIRRYETLREEPVVRACLTLAVLAHPEWGQVLSLFDIAEALERALKPMDPLRAGLIGRHLYDLRSGQLKSASELNATMRERIGFAAVERYEALREWLVAYRGEDPGPIDHFLRRLFGEVLSRAELEPEDAQVYSKLIASASSFRQAAPAMDLKGQAIGQRYVEMVLAGVVAAQYLTDVDLEEAPESIALVAPVYTYLLSGHVARFQFWLDIGSLSWWEPLHQPLTNHYVLTRRWDREERWTDAVDFSIRNRNLYRLVRGLCLRCRDGIYLCASDSEGRGEVQDGPLMMAVQQVLQEA
jgi:hypothetical protein